MSRTSLRRRLGVAALVLAATAAPSVAAEAPAATTHDAAWRPWTSLLGADPYRLPAEVGRLEGLTPATHCGNATTDLAAAVAHLGRAVGKREAVAAGVRLDATASAHVAKLVDCLATASEHLTPWDGERLGTAPDSLRAEWLGAMQDLLTLAAAVPPLQLAPAVTCVDTLCLVQTGGTGTDTYTQNAALVVDSGGNDVYKNNAGGGYLLPAAALVIDQGGSDQYVPTLTDLYGYPTIGAGYEGGVGIVVDQGGSDLYRAVGGTMGAAFAGGGALIDTGGGQDVYDSPFAGGSDYGQSQKVDHGAGAYGGFGFLYDEAGNDRYTNQGVDSIGWGGAGGTGVLVDVTGYDTYTVGAAPTGDVSGTCCVTVSGVSIGTGEVGGIGVVLDGGGDDSFACTGTINYGCIGTSYAGVLGLVFDAQGNDSHSLPPLTPGLLLAPGGLGSASAGGTGAFVDAGGTDVYNGIPWSGGYGQGGLGLFLDLGGAFDTYAGFPPPLVGTRGNGGVWVDGLGTGLGADQ